MKKFWLIIILFIPLLGCRSQERGPLSEWMAESEKIKILSTTEQIGDLVREVGGERIRSWVLIQGALDPHSYELVKGDGEKLERADLIFYNGLGLEHGAGLSRALHKMDKAEPVAERILRVHPEKILKKGGAVDPHVWMDISLWKEIVDPIVERLSLADPEGTQYYRLRADALKNEMDAVHLELIASLHSVPAEKRFLISSHDAFEYFAKSYLSDEADDPSIHRFAAPEGLAPDGQMTPGDLREIVSFLKDRRIGVIFPETNVSRDSIRKIVSASRALGMSVRICEEPLYGDAMEKGLSYLDMMRHNGAVIKSHLENQ